MIMLASFRNMKIGGYMIFRPRRGLNGIHLRKKAIHLREFN